MKKIYIVPKTEMIVVKLSSMITGSDPNAGINPEDNVDAGSIGSRRRHNNEWDDWDDDF